MKQSDKIINKLNEAFLPQNLECDGGVCMGCWKDVVMEAIKMLEDEKEIKVCTGCGWRSDVQIKETALACCPDNNYVALDDYLKNSIYKK